MTGAKKILLQTLCVVIFTMSGAPFIHAQLTTSVSPSLSDDQSSAAPTTSTEIEPGAGNLETPDNRQLPYDAIGASVVATMLDPTVTQYYALFQGYYRFDNSVRDATFLTGLPQRMPLNITDVLARKPNGLELSTRLKARSASMQNSDSSSFQLQRSDNFYPGTGATQTSSWRVGGSSLQMPAVLLPSSTATSVPSASSLSAPGTAAFISNPAMRATSKREGLLLNATSSGASPGAVSSEAQEQDYSRSPLETDQTLAGNEQLAASPFKDLSTTSFLNPDITLSSSRFQKNNRQKPGSPFARETQQNDNNPRSRLNRSMTTDTDISPAEERLMKRFDSEQMKKPKWRNPILQQMENDSDQ